MSETRITDLVAPEAIEKIKELSGEMQNLLVIYTSVAKDLAKGVDVNIRVVGDIDRLETLLVEKSKQAADVNRRLNDVITEQKQVISDTTNTISRQLMEQERLNKSHRDSYAENEKAKRLLEQFHDTYDGQLQRLIQIERELGKNKEAQKESTKALKEGKMTSDEYVAAQQKLIAVSRQLKQEKAMLNQLLTAEEKANLSVENSYAHMSQQLELLKKAYKQLSAEGRDSDYGKELEKTIQNLDAHLKDLAADQGEFQRNVGNYAIACQNGVASTEDLNRVLSLNAATIDSCIEQNKALEKAKNQLDQTDQNYAGTLEKINAKIEENRLRIMDVSDVLDKMPSTVEEAEAQNKRLAAALKLVDVNADGATETIQMYRNRIADNNEMIESVTGTNEEYANSLLSIVGINTEFGQSFQSLANSGGHSFIDGLNTKIKAFGKTLTGLLSNPWVLSILGISGVVAGFKWWYDYNKGLVEATKLTKDFTGLSGMELNGVRNEIQAVADAYDKDFREVLEAANAMSKQFGISMQESLKLMEEGFVSGADANGEFIENVKEYPAYFREAGISAGEFIAIITQANQAGIYSDKGIDVIKEGNLRIREMTTATKDALEGIGISSEQVQKDLASGGKTTFDIMQEVSEKLAEFPESSSEVGTALADIFGGPGEDAGLQYILTLKDIDTNLDNVKERAGELGRLQEEQLRSQIELENIISSVFDQTGGGFEKMTTQAKVFVNDGLVAIIRGAVDLINWFIKLYNNSVAIRTVWSVFVGQFKNIVAQIGNLLSFLVDQVKAVGKVLEGTFTLDFSKMKEGYSDFAKSYSDLARSVVSDYKDIIVKGVNDIKNGKIEPVKIPIEADMESGSGNGRKGASGGNGGGYVPKVSDEEAKRQLKILRELEESKIAIMADGHEKDLALIKLNYKKKIDAIAGDSENEQKLRVRLVEQMMKEVEKCESEYQQNLSKINLENRLASVERGSKEELDLRLAGIEASRAAEIKAAEKTGADINLINAKFDRQRLVLENDYADKLANKIQDRYAAEEVMRNQSYSKEMNALKERYVKELSLAKGNAAMQEEIKRKYEEDAYKLTVRYSQKSGEEVIKMIEEILDLENLSAEDRLKWERALAQAKIDLENQVADATIEAINSTTEADNSAKEKRIANAQSWLQSVGDVLNGIGELVDAVFDGQIEKIEEEQEANNEAGEAEQERIAELVEQNVITEEEGEARKRAAEERTAKKNEELEEKKMQTKQRQAKYDKALSVANIALNTAMALMELWVKPGWPTAIPMMAVVSALGALQLATVLATPLPKYAKGTDYHRGGLAIVGDGGRQEVVLYQGEAWLTPDTPTLVNMPKGATVIPSLTEIGDHIIDTTTVNEMGNDTPVIVNNDYRKLEDKMDKVIYLFMSLNHSRKNQDTITQLALIKTDKNI